VEKPTKKSPLQSSHCLYRAIFADFLPTITCQIQKNHRLIGHHHTAGNLGRGELDETQEINYPHVLQTILETGYQGYVAQEFIPTWSDPVQSLRHGAMVMDVARKPK